MESKFTRANGFVTSDDINFDYTTNNFHSSGGLNSRGA